MRKLVRMDGAELAARSVPAVVTREFPAARIGPPPTAARTTTLAASEPGTSLS